MTLVLSIFPGLDMLGMGFEAEGFCVVKGPDVLWGGDVRDFHPPADVFDGVIGGDPCQSHSALANLVRAKGLEPSFPDMTPEYERIIREARPAWFLRENVPQAPGIHIDGYGIHSFLLDNASLLDPETGLGQEQMRKRRFWFGVEDAHPCDLRKYIDFAALELPDACWAVDGRTGEHPSVGRSKRLAVGSGHDSSPSGFPRAKKSACTGRHSGEIGVTGGHRGSPGRYTLAEMLRLQGLPGDCLKHAPFTEQAKRKLVGNGVPIAMSRALARAVREATR